MIISVTRQHIRRGKAGEPHACPVAVALQDSGFLSAMVSPCGWDHLLVNGRFRSYRSVPRSVSRFIRRFDRGAPVRPFRFRLPPTVRLT